MNWFYGRPSAPTSATTEPLRFDPPTFDYLGPATPDQRAERKAAESPARQALNAVLMTVVLIVAGVVLMGAGVYIGATDPNVWTELPLTPEPSGERAEPEESAR